MALPSDFWTVPDAYGVTGMFVGLAIGMPLLFFRIFPGWNKYNVWHWDIAILFLVGCAGAGMLIGEIVRMVRFGYI
jgi:hypothetical protein